MFEVFSHRGTFDLAVIDLIRRQRETLEETGSSYAFITATGGSGGGSFNYGEGWQDGTIGPQTVLLHPPDMKVEVVAPRLRNRVLLLDAAPLDAVLDRHGLGRSFLESAVGQFDANPAAIGAIAQVRKVLEIGGTGASLAVDAAILELLGTMLRRRSDAAPDLQDARYARVLDYIEANLREPLTVRELAHIAGVSEFHFGRTFRRHVGLTPHAYLMRRRIARAKILMMGGNEGLVQIAYEVGFSSHSHFASVFRNIVGIPPSVWRREARI